MQSCETRRDEMVLMVVMCLNAAEWAPAGRDWAVILSGIKRRECICAASPPPSTSITTVNGVVSVD